MKILPIKDPTEKKVEELSNEKLFDYVFHCSSMQLLFPTNKNSHFYTKEYEKGKAELLRRMNQE